MIPRVVERSATYVCVLWDGVGVGGARALTRGGLGAAAGTAGCVLLTVEQPSNDGDDTAGGGAIFVRGLAPGTSYGGVSLRGGGGEWSAPSAAFTTLRLVDASCERARHTVDCAAAAAAGGSAPPLRCCACGERKALALFPAHERERAMRPAAAAAAAAAAQQQQQQQQQVAVRCKGCFAEAQCERQRAICAFVNPTRRGCGDDEGARLEGSRLVCALHAPRVPQALREWCKSGDCAALRPPCAAGRRRRGGGGGEERLPCALVRHVLGWLGARELLAAGLLCRQWQGALLETPLALARRLLAAPHRPGEVDCCAAPPTPPGGRAGKHRHRHRHRHRITPPASWRANMRAAQPPGAVVAAPCAEAPEEEHSALLLSPPPLQQEHGQQQVQQEEEQERQRWRLVLPPMQRSATGAAPAVTKAAGTALALVEPQLAARARPLPPMVPRKPRERPTTAEMVERQRRERKTKLLAPMPSPVAVDAFPLQLHPTSASAARPRTPPSASAPWATWATASTSISTV
jgi:hypothetical protein